MNTDLIELEARVRQALVRMKNGSRLPLIVEISQNAAWMLVATLRRAHGGALTLTQVPATYETGSEVEVEGTRACCWKAGAVLSDGCGLVCLLDAGHKEPHQFEREDEIWFTLTAAGLKASFADGPEIEP